MKICVCIIVSKSRCLCLSWTQKTEFFNVFTFVYFSDLKRHYLFMEIQNVYKTILTAVASFLSWYHLHSHTRALLIKPEVETDDGDGNGEVGEGWIVDQLSLFREICADKRCIVKVRFTGNRSTCWRWIILFVKSKKNLVYRQFSFVDHRLILEGFRRSGRNKSRSQKRSGNGFLSSSFLWAAN